MVPPTVPYKGCCLRHFNILLSIIPQMELSKSCSTLMTLDDFLSPDDQLTRQSTLPIYQSSASSLIPETGGESRTLGVILNAEDQVYRTCGVMKQIGFGLSIIIPQVIAVSDTFKTLEPWLI